MAGNTRGLQTLDDDSKLHKLCHDGNLRKLRDYVEKLDEKTLGEKLANRKVCLATLLFMKLWPVVKLTCWTTY